MKRALISVSDKTGIVAFAQGLVAADLKLFQPVALLAPWKKRVCQ